MAEQGKQQTVAPLDRQSLSAPVRRLIDFFEHITRDTVSDMGKHYAVNAYFKDPFNEVNGLKHIEHIFSGMFEQVDKPRFVVHTAFESATRCFLLGISCSK